MMRFLRGLMWFAALTIAAPILAGGVIGYAKGWPANWRTADWSSSGVLPEAAKTRDARVIVFAARTGRWKSIFAEHTWIVLKPEGARAWTRYDVVGWGSPVRRDGWAADAYWYGNTPREVARYQGGEAARLIPVIESAIARYPHAARGDYTVWPGPNSNTFVAWLVRDVPGFDFEMPAAAVGKDYLGPGLVWAEAPSGTGWAVSLHGLIGATLAREEGVEINLLGATIGIDPGDLAVKLPALGKIGLRG